MQMIEELDELLKHKQETKENKISFLEIIDKNFDENIISKYLLYILKNNIEILNSLLKKCSFDEFCDLEEIVFSTNEYVINGNKRIDILIKAKDITGENAVIAFENKIYSKEGYNQCKNYYDFCHIEFSGYKQYFIFLYPDFNIGIKKLSDNHFVKITYTVLLEILNSLEKRNIYEEDFMNLINNQLRSMPMDDLKQYFIEHFDQITSIVNCIDFELDSFFNMFEEIFLSANSSFNYEFQDKHRTLRLYKDSCRWKNDIGENDEKFFFYIELKCEKNLKFYVQRTLKVYSKNPSSKINRYQPLTGSLIQHDFMDTYKVFERIEITSTYPLLSNEWKQEVALKAQNILDSLSEKQEREIKNFEKLI